MNKSPDQESDRSSSECVNPTTTAMQKDIENLEKLIENLDYAKDSDLESLRKTGTNLDDSKSENTEAVTNLDESKEYLDVKKILFEHGSLQNDNRDLALEIVVQQETNAKLAQSVNDLWLFSNQLLLKLEKSETWKHYNHRKLQYVYEQLTTFKKMYHRTRFHFSQMALDFKKQLHEMRRIVTELLHQNAAYKEELDECGDLKVEVMEYKSLVNKYEQQMAHYKQEKRAMINRYETIIAAENHKVMHHQNEKDLLLEKLDSLMTKHSL